jgi:hypothetical protein
LEPVGRGLVDKASAPTVAVHDLFDRTRGATLHANSTPEWMSSLPPTRQRNVLSVCGETGGVAIEPAGIPVRWACSQYRARLGRV